MSQENLEIVRRVYEAAASHDIEAVLALYDPEVALDVSRLRVSGGSGSTEGVYHGHDGLRSLFSDWYEAYETIDYDYEDLVDAGENVVAKRKSGDAPPAQSAARPRLRCFARARAGSLQLTGSIVGLGAAAGGAASILPISAQSQARSKAARYSPEVAASVPATRRGPVSSPGRGPGSLRGSAPRPCRLDSLRPIGLRAHPPRGAAP